MSEPYYADEHACECGCGENSAPGRRFITHHNLRVLKKTEAHLAAIGEGQRRAWATKRQRKPLGSRRKDANGYWLMKVREGGGRWDKEHILVAEREIGRKILPGEHVHHINCIRDDNRPENLVVLQGARHASAHHSLNALLADLLADGVVAFDREVGRYTRV